MWLYMKKIKIANWFLLTFYMGNKNELNRYVMEKELNIDIANKQNVVQKLSHCLNVFELESQQGFTVHVYIQHFLFKYSSCSYGFITFSRKSQYNWHSLED